MRKSKLQSTLTKEILEYEYKTVGSMQKMADKLNVSIDSISKYMKLYQISYEKHYTGLYDCNENYFQFDTPDSFYWAGFIAADGCVVKRQYSKILKITLSRKDRSHLDKIKIALQSNHPIKEYYIKPSELIKKSGWSAEIQIVSKILFDDLTRFNIVPRKTFIYDMPKWLLGHPLLNHFMRGYFDGDGCISYCGLGEGRTIKQLSFSLLGNESFLINYQNVLIKKCLINENKIIPKDNVFSLSYAGNYNIEKLYNFLYKDATIFLDRKRNRFLEINQLA
jgi:hypothetical protein